MSEELLACPFCGSTDPIIHHIEAHSHMFSGLPDYDGGFTIECSGCDLGFIKDTEDEARAAWNRRAKPERKLTDELPALPHTTYNGYSDGSEPLYTADQMRDYARALLAAQPASNPVVKDSFTTDAPSNSVGANSAHTADQFNDAVKKVDEEALRDAVVNAVTGLYWCGRTWAAWSEGTMTEDDFYPAEDDDQLVGNIVQIIQSALPADHIGDANEMVQPVANLTVGRAALMEFINKFCLGDSRLIACAESAFYAFNKAAHPAAATVPDRASRLGKSLLRPAITGPGQLPEGCYCPPDQCGAPVIMGRQMPCKREPPAAQAQDDGATA